MITQVAETSLPNQALIGLRKCASEISAFMCSGKKIPDLRSSDLRLFVLYEHLFGFF